MPARNRLFATAALAAALAVISAWGISKALEQPASQPPGLASRSFPEGNQTVGQRAAPSQYGAWGFDTSGLDRSVNPGDSFFDYANGAWYARTPIRADRSRAGMFETLRQKAQDELRTIIERAAKADEGPDTEPGKIGALYSAFMNEARLEALDAAPIAEDLATIRNATSRADIARLMGRSKTGFGASFFTLTVSEDQKNPAGHTLYAAQSGLGLPDRDFYLRDTYNEKKAKYRDYVARLLDMVHWPDPQRHAADVVMLETAIAEASWSRAESRNRDKTYNPFTPAELNARAAGFPWSAWLAAAEVGEADRVVVRQSTAFPKLAKIFEDTPVETLQAWQAFHLIDQTAPFLSKRFEQARFDFRNRTLLGQPQAQPRWRRGVQLVEASLGHALGKEYVARHFSPDAKAQMEDLVGQLKIAMRGRIEALTWMTPETKAKALEKLSMFRVKTGYPSKWRDYSALRIDPADLVGNVRRANAFRWAFAVSKLGKPADPEEWNATPQTVNAFYSATRNEIVLPAGILQAPFFDPTADMAINYGGIGGVIGHEMNSRLRRSGPEVRWPRPTDRLVAAGRRGEIPD